MLYNFFTEKLIGLQGVNITNIEYEERTGTIYAKMKKQYPSGYKMRRIAVYRNSKSVPKQCRIGIRALLIRFQQTLPTLSPKATITKSRF